MKAEDLIAGETILIDKDGLIKARYKYLGYAGLVHFLSVQNMYDSAGDMLYTIEDLNELYAIEQPESKTVPLEQKVYDFVPVRFRDDTIEKWIYGKLIATLPNQDYPYYCTDLDCNYAGEYLICEFI